MNTPGLDRWRRLQTSSFGGNTATSPDAYGGSTGSQLRRLNEDYNQATRLLRRQARRGDAGSALQAIKLREEATAQGIQTGGIRQRDEFNSGILDRVRTMEEGAVDREKAAEANRKIAADAMTPEDPATPPPPAEEVPTDSRTTAALDIMEGVQKDDDVMAQRGLDSARQLGVEDPTSILRRGDQGLLYRRTLDTALGKARTPAEVAALRTRGTRMGIAPADFDRRANWWERYRKS